MPKTKKQYQKKTIKNKQKLNKNKNKNNKNKNNKTKKQTISFAQKQKAMKLLKQAIKKHIFNIINAHKIQHKKQHGGKVKVGEVGVKDPKTGKIISETERLEQIGTSIYESIVSFFRELYEWITGISRTRKETQKAIVKGVAKKRGLDLKTNSNIRNFSQQVTQQAVVRALEKAENVLTTEDVLEVTKNAEKDAIRAAQNRASITLG